MFHRYMYSIVSITMFLLVSSEAESAEPRLQKRNGFMSFTDSKGNVHSMSSGGSSGGSYMINSNSNGRVQGMVNNGNGVSSMVNFNPDALDFDQLELSSILSSHLDVPITDDSESSYILPSDIFYGSEAPSGTRRVSFSDGSFIYVPDSSAKGVNTQSVYHFPQYQYNYQASNSHASRLPNTIGSSGASGSTIVVTGGNGADAADGGADGSVMVQAPNNGPANVFLGNGKSSSSLVIGKRRRQI